MSEKNKQIQIAKIFSNTTKATESANPKVPNENAINQQISLDEISLSMSPATVTPTEEKKKHISIPLILCAAFLVCSLAGNAYQYSQNVTLNEEYTELEEYNSTLEDFSDKYFSIRDEYDFYHSKAVIVTESGSRYHTYSCYHWDYPIWIYNKEAAASEGYTPCKDCNPPQ